MNYEKLLDIAQANNLIVKETPLIGHKGRIKGNRIAIRKDITQIEKSCVLAEELGHYYTSVGDILDIQDTRNKKQELKARLWAYDKKIGLLGIINCFEHNRLYDMADYLNVTDEFLAEALNYYKSKYGLYAKLDNYIIFFEPSLGVLKFLDGM